MDLRQLEMFLAVADNSSFTLAGRQLNVAQSAVSRKIKMLEEELGESLFRRINKRVYLTQAGETLAHRARKVFSELRIAAMEVSDVASLVRGRVKIGAGLTACMYLLPPVLEQFKKRYPKVEPVVVTGTTEGLLEQVRNNMLDLGVFTLPIPFSDLEVIPFCSEELVVVSSIHHPQLAHRRSIRAAEIAEYPLILFSKATTTRGLLDEFFRRVRIQPSVLMESENVATIKPLVAINLGVTIIPLPAVLAETRRKELHCVHIRDCSLTRQIGLAFPKFDQQPKIVAELVQLFEQVHQDLPYRI
jgi:DNA-binding transcriptional LysR family regulator